MKLYIDPGTGSMLFAILIGTIGALNYILKNGLLKLKFLLSGGKAGASKDRIPFVIFSDDKRYWNIFEPVCRELDRRGMDVVYMTASPDDPALDNEYEHIEGRFIGEGNKAFAKLNFLNAVIVLSTTPGLDVYQWKRSKDVGCYVHMLHGCNEVTGYRMFGLDYYDAVMLSGEYQERDIRALEEMRHLEPKELVTVGVPYMDEMAERLSAAERGSAGQNEGREEAGAPDGEPSGKAAVRTVLLAPTWGPSSIFQKYGGKIIDELVKTGYHIIIRPHPQSFSAEKALMDKLMKEYPPSKQVEWNRDNDNFDVLRRADIMISDFSGVVFDFSLVHNKPVIYADTEFDKGPYDAWWLDTPFWTLTALPRIGQELTADGLKGLKDMIDECLTNPKYEQGRHEVIRETWEYKGEGAKRAADYLLEKYRELSVAEDVK